MFLLRQVDESGVKYNTLTAGSQNILCTGLSYNVKLDGWVIDIRDGCNEAAIPFFFKQWGGVRKKENGRLLENKIWDEMPV